jgi:hypothetical protein
MEIGRLKLERCLVSLNLGGAQLASAETRCSEERVIIPAGSRTCASQ